MKAEYAHSKVGCVSFWCLSSECSAILLNHNRIWNTLVDAIGFWRGMPQTLLQRQFPHTALPHASRMIMANRVRRFPGLTNSQPCPMARKHFVHGLIVKPLNAFVARRP